MRRRARPAALTGLVVAAVVLAGCSTDGTAAAPARTSTPSATASTPSASAPVSASSTGDPAVAACTAYANATGNPRQVVTTSSTKPVLGPAVALVLVNFRGIVSAASVPTDPPLQAAFTELTAAVDDLSTQLSAGLPAGADPVATPVAVNPARLKAALDVADGLCKARGVAPKVG